MEVELREGPFKWDNMLDAICIEFQAFHNTPLDKWWRVNDEIAPQAVLQAARSLLRGELEEDRRLVIAMIDSKVVGYATWSVPQCRRQTLSFTKAVWKRVFVWKDGVEDFLYPPKPSIDTLKFAIFKREREKAKNRNFGNEDQYWYLHVLVVDPKYQRRGIGSRLLQWGVQKSKEDGTKAYLESSPDGESLYTRSGFREVDKIILGGPQLGGGDLQTLPCMVYDPTPR